MISPHSGITGDWGRLALNGRSATASQSCLARTSLSARTDARLGAIADSSAMRFCFSLVEAQTMKSKASFLFLLFLLITKAQPSSTQGLRSNLVPFSPLNGTVTKVVLSWTLDRWGSKTAGIRDS